MLHRRIDSFSDTHAAFRRSRARVSEVRRRFGGIMVDMFYDHFLAVHWQRFSPEPLTAFTAETYRLIASPRRRPAGPLRTGLCPHGRPGLAGRATATAPAWPSPWTAWPTTGPAPAQPPGRRRRGTAGGNTPGFEADFLAFFPDALAFAERGTPGR
jgi:acyl carrier protein phosphodiesterase